MLGYAAGRIYFPVRQKIYVTCTQECQPRVLTSRHPLSPPPLVTRHARGSAGPDVMPYRQLSQYCYHVCANQVINGDEYLYFGVLDSSSCLCGGSEVFLKDDDAKTEGVCDSQCSREAPDETCGGIDAYDLYRIDRFGAF